MKAKILFLALTAALALNAAKLIYANSDTPTYEGIVKYAKNNQESYEVRNYFYDYDVGAAADKAWRKLIGTSRDTFNIHLVSQSSYENKFREDSYHILGMLRAFELGAGKGLRDML